MDPQVHAPARFKRDPRGIRLFDMERMRRRCLGRGKAPRREGIGCGIVESETDDGENGGGSRGWSEGPRLLASREVLESVDVLLLTEMVLSFSR